MTLPPLSHKPRLGTCPDCEELISPRAESCPHCGRFIQRFDSAGSLIIDRKGWSWTVAWGIILAVILSWVIGIAIFVLLMILGIGGAALLPRQ